MKYPLEFFRPVLQQSATSLRSARSSNSSACRSWLTARVQVLSLADIFRGACSPGAHGQPCRYRFSRCRVEQPPTHQPAGSDPLLESFLTAAVLDVFRNSSMFGGVLVALTATLVSDVANQDPSTTVPYLLR